MLTGGEGRCCSHLGLHQHHPTGPASGSVATEGHPDLSSQQRTPVCRDWAEGPQEAACDLQHLCHALHIFLPLIPIPRSLPGLCVPTSTPAVPEHGACCDRSCTNPQSIPILQEPAATQPGPKQVMSGGSTARHRQLEGLCCHPRGLQWSNPSLAAAAPSQNPLLSGAASLLDEFWRCSSSVSGGPACARQSWTDPCQR